MDIISSFITTFILNVEHTIIQSTMEALNILSERQKRLKEVILLHLLNITLPNQLLHIRPILQLSREKKYMDKRKKWRLVEPNS